MSGRFGCRIGRRPQSHRGTVWREVTREWYGITGLWVRIIKWPKGQALRFLYSLNEHDSSTGSRPGTRTFAWWMSALFLLPGSQHSFSYQALSTLFLTRLSALYLFVPGSQHSVSLYQALSTLSLYTGSLCFFIPGSQHSVSVYQAHCVFIPDSQHSVYVYQAHSVSLYQALSTLSLTRLRLPASNALYVSVMLPVSLQSSMKPLLFSNLSLSFFLSPFY